MLLASAQRGGNKIELGMIIILSDPPMLLYPVLYDVEPSELDSY